MNKKTFFKIFIIILLSLLSISCKKNKELLSYDTNEHKAIYYCKNKKAVISLLKKEYLINKYFNWEKDVLNNITKYSGENGEIPDKYAKLVKNAKSVFYYQFSNNIISELDEDIGFQYKDGYYIVIERKQLLKYVTYFAYIDFNETENVVPVNIINLYKTTDELEYINISKSWEADLSDL